MGIEPRETAQSEGISLQLPVWLGTLFAFLFLLGFWLLSKTPDPGATDKELLSFYQSSESRLLITTGLYIVPFAGIAFLWFMVSLSTWITQSGAKVSRMLSSIQFGSAIIFVALFFCAAAARGTVAAGIEFSDMSATNPDTLRQFPLFGYVLLFVYAMRGAAMFIIVTSRLGQTTKLFPRWLSLLGLAVGIIIMLSATFHPIIVLLFPLWILTICIFLLVLWVRRSRPSQIAR